MNKVIFCFGFLILPFFGSGQVACYGYFADLQDKQSMFFYHPLYQIKEDSISYMMGSSENVFKYYYNNEGLIERSIEFQNPTSDTTNYQIFYNPGGKIDSLIAYLINVPEQVKDEYYYDVNYNVLGHLHLFQTPGFFNDAWFLYQKFLYGYDQNNRMILQVDSFFSRYNCEDLLP